MLGGFARKTIASWQAWKPWRPNFPPNSYLWQTKSRSSKTTINEIAIGLLCRAIKGCIRQVSQAWGSLVGKLEIWLKSEELLGSSWRELQYMTAKYVISPSTAIPLLERAILLQRWNSLGNELSPGASQRIGNVCLCDPSNP